MFPQKHEVIISSFQYNNDEAKKCSARHKIPTFIKIGVDSTGVSYKGDNPVSDI